MRPPGSAKPSFDASTHTTTTAQASQARLRKGKSFDLSPSLGQIGALAWSKSAAGGRVRHLIATKAQGTTPQKGQWSAFLGYVGARSTKSGASLLSESTYSSFETHGQCFKLGKGTSDLLETTQRALLYLKLREDGCSKHQSLVFTQRKRCRFDTTKTRDGPSCHRTIALGDNRLQGPNWSGWQLHSPELLINRKFKPVVVRDQMEDYDLVTQRFEEMSRRKEDLGTEDEHRNSYFADLSREWDQRQTSHHKPHLSHALTLSIPEEVTPVPLEETVPQGKCLETETTTTETKPSFLLSSPRHSKLPSFASDLHIRPGPNLHISARASAIYPAQTLHFPSASLTLRHLLPEAGDSVRKAKVPRRRSEFAQASSPKAQQSLFPL